MTATLRQRLKTHIFKCGSDGPMYNFRKGDYRLSQDIVELTEWLAWLVENKGHIKHYLEIGAAAAGVPRVIHDTIPVDTISVIDLGDHHSHGERFWKNLKPIAESTTRLHTFLGSSHSKQAHWFLEGREIDVVLLDGDHTVEGLEADVALVSPLLPAGGVLAYHDSQNSPGVRAWLEQWDADGFSQAGQVHASSKSPGITWFVKE